MPPANLSNGPRFLALPLSVPINHPLSSVLTSQASRTKQNHRVYFSRERENMNTLDSPLEALAFNYLSFGLFTVVNNIWTWVAVITAALSFWRIRSSGLLKSDLLDRNPDEASPAAVFSLPSSSPPENIAEPASSTSASASDFPAMSKIRSFCRVEGDGLTKGKYTVYYNEDDDDDDDEFTGNEEEVDNRDGEGVEVVANEWCDGWDRVLRMRIGDMGWYRYQDLTVLDGNVVRLWDGCTCRL